MQVGAGCGGSNGPSGRKAASAQLNGQDVSSGWGSESASGKHASAAAAAAAIKGKFGSLPPPFQAAVAAAASKGDTGGVENGHRLVVAVGARDDDESNSSDEAC